MDDIKNQTKEMSDRDFAGELLGLINSDLIFTDLMIEEDAPIMAKCPGGWTVVDSIDPASYVDISVIFERIDSDWKGSIESKKSINRPLDLTQWRLRINGYLANSGTKLMMSIRKIQSKPPTIRDTGLPESVRLMLDSSKGLMLIGGATGSGKSTTLAALVNAINESRGAHIITIEDPIEFIFQRKNSVFSQREIGVDVVSFFDGVRDAMRQRPDVIVIGEIRDRDTAETALLAAESGVLVIGTVHANSASGTLQKMLSFFPSHERDTKVQSLSSTLVGVISQILLPSEDKQGWALAAELLFNHKQQVSKFVGDPERIDLQLERAEDSVSRTMTEALLALVADKRVSKADAIRAVAGLGQSAFIDRVKAL